MLETINLSSSYLKLKFFCPFYFNVAQDIFILQVLFDAADKNKDGQISLEEYSYALMSFYFYSGPDDPMSLFLGNLVELPKESTKGVELIIFEWM